MPALFVNVRINDLIKLNLFKSTIADLSGVFEEYHIKIRGNLADKCLEHAQKSFGNKVKFYQHLQDKDWVATSLEMLGEVKSRSVFLYFEDHRLVKSQSELKKILRDFDVHQLDLLTYSWFRASQIGTENILPLNPKRQNYFDTFEVNRQNIEILGKVSKKYHTFTLMSITSVEYFKELLEIENKKLKIYRYWIVSLLVLLFPYPRYRKVFKAINFILAKVNTRLCISSPNSPFNLETAWYEFSNWGREWRFGILKKELFANFDDDNGAYGESLIKRGLYPFDPYANLKQNLPNTSFSLTLKKGEFYDCTYHSQIGRIINVPQVGINLISGELTVAYDNKTTRLFAGDNETYYSNLAPIIECKKHAKLQITVYDDVLL